MADVDRKGSPAMIAPPARVAELVDAHDSKSCSARSVGSIPSTGTIRLGQSVRPALARQGRLFANGAAQAAQASVVENVLQLDLHAVAEMTAMAVAGR